MLYRIFLFTVIILSGCTFSTDNSRELCGNEKDLMGLGLMGYDNWEEALTCAEKLEKPVFLMFTNRNRSEQSFERFIYPNKNVQQYLTGHFIPLLLFTDDKEDGEKNRKIENGRFLKNSQPFYILLDKNGQPLTGPWEYTRNPAIFLEKFKLGMHILEDSDARR